MNKPFEDLVILMTTETIRHHTIKNSLALYEINYDSVKAALKSIHPADLDHGLLMARVADFLINNSIETINAIATSRVLKIEHSRLQQFASFAEEMELMSDKWTEDFYIENWQKDLNQRYYVDIADFNEMCIEWDDIIIEFDRMLEQLCVIEGSMRLLPRGKRNYSIGY